MLKLFLKQTVLPALLCTVSGCTVQSSSLPEPIPTQLSTLPNRIVIGTVAANPGWTIQQFQPLVDYLASQLDGYQIGTGEVKVAPDIQTMAKWLELGTVYLYIDQPYAALNVSQEADARPLLEFSQGNSAGESSLIVILKNSQLKTLENLKGKKIAVSFPTSTTGFVLPIAYLQAADFKLVQQSSENTAKEDELEYCFTQADQNSIQWLISGRVQAAAISSQSFQSLPIATQNAMVILAKTEAVPQQLVLVKPNSEAPLVDSIQQVLLQMSGTEKGKAALNMFEQPAKFDNTLSPDDLAELRERFGAFQSP
ncbi:MAG: phosphate/phosphite/phosphonate ABC transporter substrate-binding protein [Oscillatoriales cyanobacterium RM1_1_9]|nr:phosphate/phosphite/phosphonate ABC transporter substrate-binding protein [Oscillatoriales cyanobacterium SM2_3_0]NJO45979.1 phosphate/phosphite/phosphonate ABC transporter substrate-binding protein [Oscillatoriales cyanobacterium RM2_1_1]NJO70735.1 phosphate/phosphite/phosphonate ABC transporter substrate-binding protein [Oscillatoriales cyanobacterium RM1_1_9]